MALATVNDVLLMAIGRANPEVARYRNASGAWQKMDAAELGARVARAAGAFRAMGIGKGDRVAILSENRWEWHVTDFATLAVGAVDVPLYPTSTAEQLAFMLRDSGAKVMVLSTKEQYAKVSAIRGQTHLERILIMDDNDDGERAGAEQFSSVMAAAEPLSLGELEQAARAVQPDDLATLIYTSGTTGEPKGVMLTHGNIASNLNFATALFAWNTRSSGISFLPLSHITARALDYAMFMYGASLAYCASFADMPKTMQEVRPTILVAVPRVYEKVRQAVEAKVPQSGLKAKIFHWSLGVGRKNREQIMRGEKPSSFSYKLASKLVLGKVYAAFGGRVEGFLSGGAPLGMETAGWFADVGIRIHEGYGLTETSPVISLNNPRAYRIGSVGKVLPNVEIAFAEDGEILVRGPSIFAGYWNNLGATEEAIPSDGWFHTGDIGNMDAEGFLYITDRKKELIKTSGGKFIAPAPIENKLKANVLVGQAALVGDKQKFAALLISPNFAALEPWARAKGIKFSNHEELVEHARIMAEYRGIVAHVNSGLAPWETIKRFHVVPDEWAVETGELTPSMKLKRRVVNQRYAAAIQAFYHE